MGEIATSERLITIYLQPDSERARKTLAYARTKGLRIQEVDILKTPLTGTQIVELANRLGLEVKNLVNQEHPAYTSKFEHHELSTEDWIKLIRHNPDIMKQPIALRGHMTILVESPTDILRI